MREQGEGRSSRRRRVPVRLLPICALVAAAGCGGGPPPIPVPTPAADGVLACPAPRSRQADRLLPRRVRLVNPSPDTVDVWLDRCFHHTRLATVAPGRSALSRLPDPLVVFPEGLRFQAFVHRGDRESLGVFTLPLDQAPVAELVLSQERLAEPGALTRVALGDSVRVRSGSVLEGGAETGGYASVFAHGSGAVLSWACGGEGRPYLTLAVGGSLDGDAVDVRLRVDGGDWEEAGSWRVQRGTSDAAVAPDDLVGSLTRRALTGEEFAFVVTRSSGRREAHAFRIGELAPALARRTCLRSVVPGS